MKTLLTLGLEPNHLSWPQLACFCNACILAEAVMFRPEDVSLFFKNMYYYQQSNSQYLCKIISYTQGVEKTCLEQM